MENGPGSDGLQSLCNDVLQQVVTACTDAIVLVDARHPQLGVVYVNPAYEALSGYAADELVGAPWRLMRREGTHEREFKRLEVAIGCAEACRVTLPDVRKDGSRSLDEISVTPLKDSDGEVRFFMCSYRSVRQKGGPVGVADVSVLKREVGPAHQRVATVDRTDSATGLLRYEHFSSLLARDLAVARRGGRSVAVLLFEVVELDVYRHTFGTNAADSCLRMIGAQLAGAFRRAGDLCGRCGESSLVAVAQEQDEEQAAALAARVVEKVRGLGLHNPRAKSGRYLTVRSAVAAGVPDSDDAAAFIERARARLRGDSPAAAQSYAVS